MIPSQPPQGQLVSETTPFIYSEYFLSLTVPSAPPSSVRLSVKNSTSISVRWEPVECRHRNGEIIDYYVRYGEEGRRIVVSGDSSGGTTTISELMKQTVYTVEVAARTSAGTGAGVYSTIETPDSKQVFFIDSNLIALKIQMSSSV